MTRYQVRPLAGVNKVLCGSDHIYPFQPFFFSFSSFDLRFLIDPNSPVYIYIYSEGHQDPEKPTSPTNIYRPHAHSFSLGSVCCGKSPRMRTSGFSISDLHLGIRFEKKKQTNCDLFLCISPFRYTIIK